MHAGREVPAVQPDGLRLALLYLKPPAGLLHARTLKPSCVGGLLRLVPLPLLLAHRRVDGGSAASDNVWISLVQAYTVRPNTAHNQDLRDHSVLGAPGVVQPGKLGKWACPRVQLQFAAGPLRCTPYIYGCAQTYTAHETMCWSLEIWPRSPVWHRGAAHVAAHCMACGTALEAHWLENAAWKVKCDVLLGYSPKQPLLSATKWFCCAPNA